MMAGKKEVWTPKLCIEGEKSSLRSYLATASLLMMM